jgi:hypothetical protein
MVPVTVACPHQPSISRVLSDHSFIRRNVSKFTNQHNGMSTKTSLSRKHHENVKTSSNPNADTKKKAQRSWYFPWRVQRIPMSNAASEVQCLHHVAHASGWFKSLYHVVLLYLSISIITSVSPVLALRILFYICMSIPNAISPSWVFNGSISVSP